MPAAKHLSATSVARAAILLSYSLNLSLGGELPNKRTIHSSLVNLVAPVSCSSCLANVVFPAPINPMTMCASGCLFPCIDAMVACGSLMVTPRLRSCGGDQPFWTPAHGARHTLPRWSGPHTG